MCPRTSSHPRPNTVDRVGRAVTSCCICQLAMVCIVCDDEALQLILANGSRWRTDGPNCSNLRIEVVRVLTDDFLPDCLVVNCD